MMSDDAWGVCDDMALNYHVDTSMQMLWMSVQRHGNGLPCRHMYASVGKRACDEMVSNYHVDTSFGMQENHMRRHGMRLPSHHKF